MRAIEFCAPLGVPVSDGPFKLALVFIGLGSNLGDRANHLKSGVEALRYLGELIAVSNVYESEPVGVSQPQPAFLNMVVSMETGLAPASLLDEMLAVEQRHGRLRQRRNAPRTLDLDMLAYGELVMGRQDLTIPHPRIQDRAFVLMPLTEVAPGFLHPVEGVSLAEMMVDVSSQCIRVVGTLEDLVGKAGTAV